MNPAVEAAIAELPKQTVNELRAEYQRIFGETTSSRHKLWLVRRIAWRIQADAEGGLSERALARARELANEADIRLTPPRQGARPTVMTASISKPLPVPASAHLVPGTLLRREWKGIVHQVRVLDEGFEHNGVMHRTLSAAASAITGSKWNGFVFFGLKKRSGDQ